MSTIREQETGLFRKIKYLAAIVVVAVATSGKGFQLVVGSIAIILPLFMWWEIWNIEQDNDPSRRPRHAITKGGSGSQGTMGRLTARETKLNGNNRVYPPSMYPDDLGRYAERNFV